MSSRFFENQPNGICHQLSKKTGFLGQISSKITLTREKERRKRNSKEEERRRREKGNNCTLSCYLVTLEIVQAEKKTVGHKKGPFRGNVFKNSARCMCACIYVNTSKALEIERQNTVIKRNFPFNPDIEVWFPYQRGQGHFTILMKFSL